MSSLVNHAEMELRAAGLFDEDSDYGGMLGPSVMKLVRAFAEEGHSGYSAGITIHLFSKVASYQLLSPINNPLAAGEYHDVSYPSGTPPQTTLQSTRLSSLFSEDSGKTWYDIDKKLPRWKQFLRRLGLPLGHRAYVVFPYMPK